MSVSVKTRSLTASLGLLGLITAACTPTPPTAPGVSIGPVGATTVDDLVLVFDGEAREPGGAPLSLFVSWTVDGQERADLAGARTVPAAQTRKGQAWSVSVVPGDGRALGEARSASMTIANSAPTVEIEPLKGVPSADEDVVAVARAADPDDDALNLSWSWTLDGVDAGVQGPVLPAALTARGQVWTVSVVADDGEASSAPASATVSIANRAPSVAGLSLTPGVATTTSTLTASGVGIDPDGDAVEITWVWYVNGVEVQRGLDNTLHSGAFGRGDAVFALAIPTDGFIAGEPSATPVVEIRNTVPSVARAVIAPETLYGDTVATCVGDGFVDADGDPEAYRISWEVDGRLAGTAASLPPTAFSRGQSVVCVLVPTDGIDDGVAVRSEPLRVQNAAPLLASAEIVPGSPRVTDALVVALGEVSDRDGDAVTLRYRWSVDGAPAGEAPTLAGAFAKGQTVSVQVEPFDGIDAGVPVVATAVTVRNTPPVATAVSLSPASPTASDDIVAHVDGIDADGDDLTWTVTWRVDGAVVAGVTGLVLPAGTARRDQTITAEVVPFDGDDEGEALMSGAITAVNSAPTFAAVAVTPDVAYTDTDLRCDASGFEDADGDEPAFKFRWLVNGAEAGSTGTLASSAFVRGDVVTCTATAFDGIVDSEPRTAAAVTIRNSAPALSGLSLTDTAPRTGDVLTYTFAELVDADGDDVSVRARWTVDGEVVGDGATLALDGIVRGAVVELTLTPQDSEGLEGEPLVAVATVANTAPVVTSVALSPDEIRTNDAILAVATGEDADGDALAYVYTWYVGGAVVSGVTGPSLDASFFVKGDEIRVEVVADDGEAMSAPFEAAAVYILNTAPSVADVALTPSAPRRGDEVACSPSGWNDADLDTASYRYLWSTGETTAAIDTSDLAAGTTLWCTATPFDGEAEGEAVTSVSVELLAAPPRVVAIALPERVRTADDVTATVEAIDEEGREVSLAFRWMIDGDDASTEAFLSASATRKGQSIQLAVTPSVGGDLGDEVISAAVVVENTAPELAAITLSPTAPTALDAITATVAATDADDDALSSTFSWYVNGSRVADVTGGTLAADHFAKGDSVSARVVVTDGEAEVEGDAVAVSIVNAAPTAPTVAILGSGPDDDLLCDIVVASTDADEADTVVYRYAWTVDGAATDLTSELVSADLTEAGQVWSCTVVATDGEADSDAAEASVTVRECRFEVAAHDHVSIDAAGGAVDTGAQLFVARGDGSDFVGYTLFHFGDSVPMDREITSVAIVFTAREVLYEGEEPLFELGFVRSTEWARDTATADELFLDGSIDGTAFSASAGETVTIALSADEIGIAAAIEAGSFAIGLRAVDGIDELLADFDGAGGEGAPRLIVRTATCD